jgi:phosphatidylglycerophosphate synthase
VLIITIAGAINIITGFRGFKPSFWGKVSTLVQVIGISLVMFAAVSGYSIFLPTTYFVIVLLVVISGVHYIFQVASLMKKEEQASSSEDA